MSRIMQRFARPIIITCNCCSRKAKPADNDTCCQECYEIAGIQNTIYDYGIEEAMRLYGSELESLVRECLRKGGDRSKLYAEFDFLPQIDQVAEPKKERKAGKRTGSHPATRFIREWAIRTGNNQRKARAYLRSIGEHAPYGPDHISALNIKFQKD